MQLTKPLQKHYAGVVRFAANRMEEEANHERVLYFLSAIWGESGRVLNFEWDADVALIHNVTRYTYEQVQSRLPPGPGGVTRLVGQPDEVVNQLKTASGLLADWVERSDADRRDLAVILGRFAEIGFAATGNGQFLQERGVLSLT